MLFSGLVGGSARRLTVTPNNGPSSSIAYDEMAGVQDVFDWSMSTPQPHAARFESLMVFSLQLFCLVNLGFAAVYWSHIILSLAFQPLGGRRVSTTQVSLGVCVLEHAILACMLTLIAPMYVSFRILLVTPLGVALLW